jgi:hypothetical protein
MSELQENAINDFNSLNSQDSSIEKTGKRSKNKDHPFNGPKLHLYKKGQSISSQQKSRKIKTSENNQRMIAINKQAQAD